MAGRYNSLPANTEMHQFAQLLCHLHSYLFFKGGPNGTADFSRDPGTLAAPCFRRTDTRLTEARVLAYPALCNCRLTGPLTGLQQPPLPHRAADTRGAKSGAGGERPQAPQQRPQARATGVPGTGGSDPSPRGAAVPSFWPRKVMLW